MSVEQVEAGVRRNAFQRLNWDIETVSGWDELPAEVRATYLRKHRESELRKPLECRGALDSYPPAIASTNPWTGKIVCIALYDPDQQKGRVLFVQQPFAHLIIDEVWRYEPYETEAAMLAEFWSTLARHPSTRLEGFNSRGFDASYVFIRSYILGVPCLANVLPYKYSTKEHLDLFDVLGCWERGKTPSLDVVCRLAGIESPKSGLTGKGVQKAWNAGDVIGIARYCARDVVAQAEAVDRWDATVGKVFGERRKAW